MKIKSMIYKGLRISNDINAIKKGKVGQRIGRRVAGKLASRFINRLFR